MAPGQDELTILSFPIHDDLYGGKEFGHSLNLIYDKGPRKGREKGLGITKGEFAPFRILQIDIIIIGTFMAREGGLSGLPRAKNGHYRVLAQRKLEFRNERPRNIGRCYAP